MTITLVPMTQPEYDDWHESSVATYAQEFVESGILTPEEARKRADREFAELLPDGLATENHLLWGAHDEAGTLVGTVWVALVPERTPPHSFVYGLDVNADQRRKGYGRAIMEVAMEECRQRGIATMGLNVFGHNDTARRLYERLGFQVASTSMRIDL